MAFAAFTYLGFFNALAPEHSSDGMAYHLNEVLKYRSAHGFPHITTDVYANLSQGIELLYLLAFDFGRHSAASVVHFTFLVALAFLILSYGRRIGRPEVGVAAAIFTYASPIVLRDATIAYVDVALAAVLFALFYLLQIWDENRDPKMLVPIGILAGFAYEVKYTAIVAVPYAAAFVAWKLWRARKPVLRPVLVVSLLAAACILPWMVKDWIEVANPVSPLANRLFPNPYVHISFEDSWRNYLSNYYLTSRWQIPLQVTVEGDKLEGFLGPLFLLTPFALLALRFRVRTSTAAGGRDFRLHLLQQHWHTLPDPHCAVRVAGAGAGGRRCSLAIAHAGGRAPPLPAGRMSTICTCARRFSH